MIDWSKPVRTTTFQFPVRVLCIDANNPTYPVIGLVGMVIPSGWDMPVAFTLDGRSSVNSNGCMRCENYEPEEECSQPDC